VGVLHYLVAQESLHDLAVGDDSIRRRAFQSPLANLAGSICPRPLRPSLVRTAARQSHWVRHLPAPAPIQEQFQKLALEAQLCRHSHSLVAVGPRFARTVSRLYPEAADRIRPSRAGVPQVKSQLTWPWPRVPERLRALAVGRPTGQKGWDYLVEALSRLESRQPVLAQRLDLVIAGGLGDATSPWSHFSRRVGRSLQALAHVRVHNAGEVSHEEVLGLMQGADLLVHPAVFEPFGLVVLEAMALGCSILTTDADGPADLVAAPWGQRVPFGEPTQRATGLEAALEGQLGLTRAQLNAHGAAAREAAQSFTWERCAADHLGALEAAVASSKAPTPARPRRTERPPPAPIEARGTNPNPT
jgi:glycosyltransferase involved in cell wall biosynthesis